MYDTMSGLRVIEHTFVPAAGMVLADWGADVIKVERTVGGGDPARSLLILQRPGQKRNAFFEVANRGKRSLGLDLNQAEGREFLYCLVRTADVFITNLRTSARGKLGIEPADLLKLNPRLIYGRARPHGRPWRVRLSVVLVPVGFRLRADAGRRTATPATRLRGRSHRRRDVGGRHRGRAVPA
jgi:formyl-CoA transferase